MRGNSPHIAVEADAWHLRSRRPQDTPHQIRVWPRRGGERVSTACPAPGQDPGGSPWKTGRTTSSSSLLWGSETPRCLQRLVVQPPPRGAPGSGFKSCGLPPGPPGGRTSPCRWPEGSDPPAAFKPASWAGRGSERRRGLGPGAQGYSASPEQALGLLSHLRSYGEAGSGGINSCSELLRRREACVA